MKFVNLMILLLLLVFLVQPASAALGWETDSDIINGLSATGTWIKPAVFNDDGTWKMIAGNYAGQFYGYQWNGTGWEANATLVSGIVPRSVTSPEVFYMDGDWYLIVGYSNLMDGYKWNGAAWESNLNIVNGITPTDNSPNPEVFNDSGTFKLLIGYWSGNYDAYQWNGTGWEVNSSVSNGIGTGGFLLAPTVWNSRGTWYLIQGMWGGGFIGYHWSGSTWTTDSSVISGLPLSDSNTGPEVFYMDNHWQLIFGESVSVFNGYIFNESVTSNLRTEGVVNNHEVITNITAPYFTWEFSDAGNNVQTNWQIQVGTTQGASDKWNGIMSGTDTSDTYAGLTLEFNIIYYVQVATNDGTTWSTWETGTFMILDLNTYADLDFIATITSDQNTALQQMNTSFGDMIAGNTLILSPSFNLTNSGNSPALIEATFTTEYSGIYGFANTTAGIGGTNFSVQKDTSTWDTLDNLLAGTSLTDTVLADNIPYNWNARLTVPAGQVEATYIGTIELTFS